MTSPDCRSEQQSDQYDSARRRRWLIPVLGAVAALMLVVSLVQISNNGAQADQPDPREMGFPEAPAQDLPDRESTAGAAGTSPITSLVDATWAEQTASRTEIPQRAVQAYAGAALYMNEIVPECNLGWNVLAGIGRVESGHGAYGGASIDENGVVDPPIIGVPLDGSDGVMEVPDTDDGELDGDTEWDRAVGPMQFIPETWRNYGTDANFSGEANIHQYDDAALTAAAYLCDRSPTAVTTDEGFQQAISAYNQSADYAQDVARYAELYSGTE